jgi:integrase
LAEGTAPQIHYQASARSGVRRVGGIHTLRPCFASHALEDGRDLFALKRWMGHRALGTTGRYLHVVPGTLRKVLSPLDTLDPKAQGHVHRPAGGCLSASGGDVFRAGWEHDDR